MSYTPVLTDARTDESVLEAYRSGEAGALEVLVRRYHDDLMRFLLRLVGERSGAEDVFQDTFLQIHLAANTFDASRRFKPWLFTIAANKARDYLRRSTRRRTLDLSAPVPGKGGAGSGGGNGSDGSTFVDLLQIRGPLPGEIVDLAERDRLVQRAVSELPVSLREVLLLAYFQRQSYNDIAESLEIPLGTVKSRLHAAVAAFARRWQELSGEASTRTESRG